MNFVKTQDGTRIAYDEAGIGPAMVFAHCLGASRVIWAPVIAQFKDRYRCIAYDLRGQGDSSVPPGPYSGAGLAADAIELLDALGVERCVFVGVSMGGMVAQELALRAPERLNALVLADTAPGFEAAGRALWAERIAQLQRDGVASIVALTMERWFSEGFRQREPARVAEIAALLAASDLDGYLASCAVIRDHEARDRLGRIAAPTLVVCGENDPATPLPLSEALAAGIPRAQLAVMAGFNHLPCVEAPAAFSGIVSKFLEAVQ